MNKANSKRRYIFAIVCICLFFYTFTNTGGIFSPDSEVVFRVAESLESKGVFYLEKDIDNWKGFGLANGQDGKLYSVFGPLESVALVPFIKFAKIINETGWFEHLPIKIPLSYYILPTNIQEPHSLRFIAMFFNIIVGILCVIVFWLIGVKLIKNELAAFVVSIIYALGTLMWHYSNTLFSEPLATFFVLLSFYYILPSRHYSGNKIFFSGLFLGLATATHISTILFFPFFIIQLFHLLGELNFQQKIKSILPFLVGFSLVIILLGYYNYIRFGNVFETGRSIDETSVSQFGYGQFVNPFQGIWGLLISPGKGILLYCPAIILGLLTWKNFYKSNRILSIILIWTIIFRIVFIASRTDWHGGFSLGPRYLVMIIPFMLIPVLYWLKDRLHSFSLQEMLAFGAVVFVLIAEQFYFTIGEIFMYFNQFMSFTKDNIIYHNWKYSPLIHLLDSWRGPYLLLKIQLSNYGVWLIGSLLIFILSLIGCLSLRTHYGMLNSKSKLED